MGPGGFLLSLIVVLGAGSEAGAGLGDPTLPPGPLIREESAPEPAREVQWMLAVVKFSPNHRSAVLNGRVVREGDRIADARVIRILRDAVILEHRGQRVRVTLQHPPGKEVRTRASSSDADQDR